MGIIFVWLFGLLCVWYLVQRFSPLGGARSLAATLILGSLPAWAMLLSFGESFADGNVGFIAVVVTLAMLAGGLLILGALIFFVMSLCRRRERNIQ